MIVTPGRLGHPQVEFRSDPLRGEMLNRHASNLEFTTQLKLSPSPTTDLQYDSTDQSAVIVLP